ncbi:anthranilate phosphoribosyltransferase [Sporichthya sp.]|uniref:anthranilate phosphoribosyltransferase n=1 Tax=Sporichthya sp. TaxID=65475 RepID=UPI0017E005CF|nr:anthranilate phosphoribosyltransferase [Sporichthya sp.]MBA3744141.1 anthranilate phosphoribosyltransferase [Sporichthya sp.]
MTTWPGLLGALVRHEDLDADTTAWAMAQIMGGEASEVHIAAFAVALRSKGETVAEVEGLVRAMFERARLIEVPGPTLDIVGSGGDQAHTVNISTMASIVAAATGVRVVKHGNRAASSACGTADVLEELGVALDLAPDDVAAVALEAGITFCFAPVYHPALRHAIPVRRELAIPTIFNFLGPLANPARPTAQAVGVADRRIAPIAAGVLARRGISALVFRGDDGLDELTTTTTSSYWEVRTGSVTEGTLDPASLGVPRSEPGDLRGGDKVHNAGVVRDLLAGKTGPVRDAVLLNAGAALAMCDPTDTAPLLERIERGIATAAASVDDASAARLLDDWIAATTARRPG